MRLFLVSLILLPLASCFQKSVTYYLDKPNIARIDVLAGDSTIFNDWQEHQDSGLMVMNGDVYFVTIKGNTLHKPMQTVSFIGKSKDSLIDIINSFLRTNDTTTLSACVLLLRHSLLVYSKDNRLIDKADICFDCGEMILHSNMHVDMDKNKMAHQKLIALFKAKNIYLYNAEKR